MASTHQMMKLPAARAGQIKALAAARGLGATEAVELLLNHAIENGLLPDVLPGLEVIRDGSKIVLTLDGKHLPAISATMALAVADDFEHAGTAQVVGKGRPRFYQHDDKDFMLAIGRHGSGVVVALEEVAASGKIGEGKRTTGSLTRGMALDLARQIRKAAADH